MLQFDEKILTYNFWQEKDINESERKIWKLTVWMTGKNPAVVAPEDFHILKNRDWEPVIKSNRIVQSQV